MGVDIEPLSEKLRVCWVGEYFPRLELQDCAERGHTRRWFTRNYSTGFCGIDIHSLYLVPAPRFYSVTRIVPAFYPLPRMFSVLSFRPSL